MKRKLLSVLSNLTFGIGIAVGAFALIEIYIIRSRLPSGTCPVSDNKPLLYTSIALLAISFLISLFEPKTKK